MMKKKLIVLGMCVVMAFSMTACKKKIDSKETTTVADDAEQTTALLEGLNKDDKIVDGKDEIVKLADYKNLKVGKSKVKVEDSAVSSSVNQVLDNYPVKKGTVTDKSVVNIDYVGKIDGKEFEGGTAQSQTLDIANSNYIKGFAEGLVGKKIGDVVKLNLKFPDNYGKDKLNGKDVVFTVTINSVRPELTDAFVSKNLKEEYDVATVAELKDYIKEQMVLSAKYSATWKGFVGDCVVKISQEEVDKLVESGLAYYENYVKTALKQELKDYLESKDSSYDEFKESLNKEAMLNIKEQIVAEAIADAEKITVSDEEYKKEAQYYIDTYDYKDLEAFEKDYDKEDVKKNVLYYKIVELVSNKVEVVDDSEIETTSESTTAETATTK